MPASHLLGLQGMQRIQAMSFVIHCHSFKSESLFSIVFKVLNAFFFQSIVVVGLLCCVKLCASNALNDEYQPEILGSPNLDRTEKGARNPKIFWGVSFSGL